MMDKVQVKMMNAGAEIYAILKEKIKEDQK